MMYPSPSSVAFENEPVWFLKERVVVSWQDDDHDRGLHLGEPSPLNKDASLVLWFGLNEANNQAVAMLQLTVTHYVKAKRKRFDVFSIPTGLQFVNEDVPILSIDDIPTDISRMFEDIEGSSKSRFLRLSLQKAVPSQTLMPIRKTARPVQGAAEHVMLSAKTFTESAEKFDIYMGYSTYAHQALETHTAALKTSYKLPDFQLAFSYNHNGGAFNSWDDYLDTDRPRKATDIDLAQDRHAHKRKRTRYHQGEEKGQGEARGPRADTQGPRAGEEEAPPAYTKACTQVQVPASDGALSPCSAKCRDGTIVPTTPPNRGLRTTTATNWLLDPLNTPESLPPGPLFSPRGDPAQRVPLDAHFLPLTKDRPDVPVALHEAFVTWLFSMRKLRPYLHEDPELYTMLVAYGLAIQRGDVARFPNIKSRATSLVLKLHVTSMAEARDWDVPAEKLVQRLVRWMCGHVLHADEDLVNDLLLLTQRAVDSTLAKRDEYLLQEATCVANFFVKYTQPLSRHLKTRTM